MPHECHNRNLEFLFLPGGKSCWSQVFSGPSGPLRPLVDRPESAASAGHPGRAELYLPATPEYQKLVPDSVPLDHTRSDTVDQLDPAIQFATSEVRAGRLPLWDPYQYCGAPYRWPKFSPFFAVHYLLNSPVAVAWRQALAALVAGVGAYCFFRRVLTVGFWPAAIVAWCYPLTGFFILWQSYAVSFAIVWLPWMLLAVDGIVRRSPSLWGPALALLTCLNIVGGPPDLAGQVLLASGIFATGCYLQHYAGRWFSRPALRAAAALALAWTLGILLATPDLFPLLEYTHTGSRMARRSQGEEERPPVGLAALPQMLLPGIYGSTRIPQAGGWNIFPTNQGNLQESSATAYVGLLAALLVGRWPGAAAATAPSTLYGLSWS